jgi:hypothetical protein
MSYILRFLRVFALGTWVGAIIYFAAVVTQGAFAVLPSQDDAGLLVEFTLSGLHLMGLIAAVVFILTSVALRKSLRAFIEPAVIGVILMAGLTIASQGYVMPKMAVLRSQMGSIQATPGNDPRRLRKDQSRVSRTTGRPAMSGPCRAHPFDCAQGTRPQRSP